MIKLVNILCPVDFFPASQRAVEYAAALARNYDSTLHLLHVVSAVVPTSYEFPINAADIQKQLEAGAADRIKEVEAAIADPSIAVRSHVAVGDIHESLAQAVERTDADLVVMGTHGRRGFERWFLGSVTERALRHSTVPILTMSDLGSEIRIPPAVNKILVTTDFSDGTSRALEFGFAIAQEAPAEVTLLHVMQQPAENRGPIEEVRKILVEHLDSMVPPDVKDWCQVTPCVEVGTPYQRILAIAAETEVDLIVMNIHGIGLWERALMGATAERVLRAAECPVLAIPPVETA